MRFLGSLSGSSSPRNHWRGVRCNYSDIEVNEVTRELTQGGKT